jgi:hypothetical protein
MSYLARVTPALARRFIEAVGATRLRGGGEISLSRRRNRDTRTERFAAAARGGTVLEKTATGYENVDVERTEPEFEEIDGDVLARAHEVGRWRETAQVL